MFPPDIGVEGADVVGDEAYDSAYCGCWCGWRIVVVGRVRGLRDGFWGCLRGWTVGDGEGCFSVCSVVLNSNGVRLSFPWFHFHGPCQKSCTACFCSIPNPHSAV